MSVSVCCLSECSLGACSEKYLEKYTRFVNISQTTKIRMRLITKYAYTICLGKASSTQQHRYNM